MRQQHHQLRGAKTFSDIASGDLLQCYRPLSSDKKKARFGISIPAQK
jgi:hypothetical protein